MMNESLRPRRLLPEPNFFFWSLILLALAFIWLGYFFIGSNIVESAYKGESFEHFNRLIKGQDTYPVDYYLARARNVVVAISIVILTLAGLYSFVHAMIQRKSQQQIQQFAIARSTWFQLLITIAILLILLTFARDLGLPPHVPFFPWRLFDLGVENNLGAWFSGTLLLVGALHAFDGFVLEQHERRVAAVGWLILSAILMGLSLDEVGSLHERVSANIVPLVEDSTPGLSSFKLILVLLLVTSLISLWTAKESRRQVLGLLVGFGVLATVPIQEHLEHTVNWGTSRWVSASRLVVEEGSELLGMLIIIRACMPNSGGIFQLNASASSPTLALPDYWPRFIAVIVAVFMIPILTLFSVNIDETTPRGYPASWLASVLFLFTATSAAREFFEHGKSPKRADATVAILFILASIAVVSTGVQFRFQVPGLFEASSRMVWLFVLGVGITLVQHFRFPRMFWGWTSAMFAIMVVTLVFIQSTNLVVLFGLPCLFALTAYMARVFGANVRDGNSG